MKNLAKQIKEIEELNYIPKKDSKLKNKNLEPKENYMKWSIEKLNEEIKGLKKSMNENEETYNFKNAEKDKKKIIQLSKVKDKKNINLTKDKQKEEKKNLKNVEKEELKEFDNKMNEKWDELQYSFDGMKSKLKQLHEEELKKFNEDFEKKYGKIKESKELMASKKELKVYRENKE